MYFLFRYHNVMPGAYRDMPYGEKQVVRAFMHWELDERKKESGVE